MQTADDLGGPQRAPAVRTDLGARRYDVFGTANFFNFTTWTASIEYLLACGAERIARHDQALVSRFLDGLDRGRYRVESPEEPGERSTLVFFTHRDADRNSTIHRGLRREGIDLALRRGSLRLAPHLYNTPGDIDRTLEALHALA